MMVNMNINWKTNRDASDLFSSKIICKKAVDKAAII